MPEASEFTELRPTKEGVEVQPRTAMCCGPGCRPGCGLCFFPKLGRLLGCLLRSLHCWHRFPRLARRRMRVPPWLPPGPLAPLRLPGTAMTKPSRRKQLPQRGCWKGDQVKKRTFSDKNTSQQLCLRNGWTTLQATNCMSVM